VVVSPQHHRVPTEPCRPPAVRIDRVAHPINAAGRDGEAHRLAVIGLRYGRGKKRRDARHNIPPQGHRPYGRADTKLFADAFNVFRGPIDPLAVAPQSGLDEHGRSSSIPYEPTKPTTAPAFEASPKPCHTLSNRAVARHAI
jgi:hypothetical protein